MIDPIRAALAAIPPWVWPILVGTTFIADGCWTLTHTRQLQERQARAWLVAPQGWRARFLRGPFNRFGLRVVAVANIVVGVLFVLWGLVNL